MLWLTALERGYAAPIWMTYRQASALGGHVRKGERGTLVVYANCIQRTETDPNTGEEQEREIPFLKGYTVFSVEQIDGLPAHFYALHAPRLNPRERNAHAEAFFRATGADVRYGGNQACYSPAQDIVRMPPFESFRNAESFYGTLGHEFIHNAVIRIMPASVLDSRKQLPPAHRYRHNQRDSRKAPDRPHAPSAAVTANGSNEPTADSST